MQVIKGNKKIKLGTNEFQTIVNKFENVTVDLGTGDGRFVFARARENPKTLVIGVDPSQNQMSIYSKKVNKEKLENSLFVVGAVEDIPNELKEIADEVFINFPWGSLLGGVVNAESIVIKNIISLLKPKGKLEITFGYSQDAEPSEVERLGLNNLDNAKIQNEIIPKFNKEGVKFLTSAQLNRSTLLETDSTWGKKLSFGKHRKVFKLNFIKN